MQPSQPTEKHWERSPLTGRMKTSHQRLRSGKAKTTRKAVSCKEGKPDGFHYSEHRTVDSKNNIVVNVRITPANVNDVDPVPDILNDIEKRLGHLPTYMGVDAGYHNAPTCHQIASRGIQPVVGYRRHTHKGERFEKYRFIYQKDKNVYLCPQKQELAWKTTNRSGYREYWSDSKVCKNCPYKEQCISSSMTRRLVTRHVWQDDLEQADGRPTAGNAFTHGASRQLNVPSQKAKNSTACALLACLGFATCMSSPSLALQSRT